MALAKRFIIEVGGPWACFTRPEMKVERVSYDIITPSAARSIFEAIMWKPCVRWSVRRIDVLNEIKWMSFKVNEINGVRKLPERKAPEAIDVSTSTNRIQRTNLVLRDVRYRLYADLEFVGYNDRANCEDDTLEKYTSMFYRRASAGQSFKQPYLGCREFSCSFQLVGPGDESLETPIDESRDLGWMLYDLDYQKNAACPMPMMFRAEMLDGMVDVPHIDDTNRVVRA